MVSLPSLSQAAFLLVLEVVTRWMSAKSLQWKPARNANICHSFVAGPAHRKHFWMIRLQDKINGVMWWRRGSHQSTFRKGKMHRKESKTFTGVKIQSPLSVCVCGNWNNGAPLMSWQPIHCLDSALLHHLLLCAIYLSLLWLHPSSWWKKKSLW